MFVRLSVALNAPLSDCWELLKKTATLSTVTNGMMTYDGAADLPEEWTVGVTTNLKPRLWDNPQGDHFVTVMEVDELRKRIVTKEHGGAITTWNHTMELQRIGPHLCRYTDTIEIKAGWQTVFIWLFALYFYRYRHQQWQKLVER